MNVPHTRLSTRMSGSAKETEQRLRNLFARHKRPALLLVAVVALAIGLCGGLVACRSTTQAGSFTMDTQYYDALGNYIEIPRLTAEGEGAQAVNQALTALKSQYQTVMDAPMNTVGGQQCLFYPAVTERYDNLIFYLDSASSGSDGGLYTLVYDRQEDRVVPLAEALELAGTTEDALCRGAEEYLNGELAGTEVALAARDGAVTGFRIRDDGGVEFYLTCMTDDADPAVDAVDGWQHLLAYADGNWRHYNCKATLMLTEELLIPAEELAGFDTPLWYQWGPSGGVPEGGFLLQQIPEQVENQAQVFLEGEGYHAPPDSLLLRVCFDDLSGLELASEWQGYDAMECYRMTYSVPDTHRAVDLLFFRRGEDYTYVGELIGMDYQTVEPTRLASVGPYNYAVMYHLLEQGILTAFPEADAMLRDAPMPLAARNAAVAYFYSNRPADMSIFFADQAPLQPEGRTMRIDEASYLGLRQLYETYGVVYQLRCSGWEDGDWYSYPEPLWLVFQLGQGGDMTTVLGESVPRETVEQGYHLVDGTVALWRDGYPNPAGPGSEVGFFQEEPVVTVLEGAEPIYQAGDWWQQMEWEGLSALCYCNADGGYAIQRLETTRTDLFTDRGIRVGSTRAEVEAAYGEKLSRTDYWGLYPGEDYLWYCADPEGWGAAILFFFDGDQVSRIVLNNMFN